MTDVPTTSAVSALLPVDEKENPEANVTVLVASSNIVPVPVTGEFNVSCDCIGCPFKNLMDIIMPVKQNNIVLYNLFIIYSY